MTNAPETATAQGSHHYLITLQRPLNGGFSISTWSGECTPPEGAHRSGFYLWLREDIARAHPEFADASVLFFDIQPNRLWP